MVKAFILCLPQPRFSSIIFDGNNDFRYLLISIIFDMNS